jgi:hypothetical protein
MGRRKKSSLVEQASDVVSGLVEQATEVVEEHVPQVREVSKKKQRRRRRRRLFLLALIAAGVAVFANMRKQASVPVAAATTPAPAPPVSDAPASPVSDVEDTVPTPAGETAGHSPDAVSDPETDPLSEGAPVVPDDGPGSFFDQVMAETPAKRGRAQGTAPEAVD